MALRSLMLGKKIREAKKKLEEARAKLAELETREAELEKSIEEAETEEETAAVEEAVEGFPAEKEAAETDVRNLEAEVEKLERELSEIEETPAEKKDEPEKREAAAPQKETRVMNKRWKEMSYEERTAFVQRDEMQAFLGEIRTAIREKRAISNAGYLIPQVFLGLLRENILDYAKLYGRVNLRQVSGTGRVAIEGTIPEAVWTEACANLNELDLSFSKVEVDGYKVGGYFKVCNATLEDSDVDLASELIRALGAAIGIALDKAILYGTGTKMPVGILTALEAVSDTPNIVTIANTVHGKDLVVAIINAFAKAKGKYSRGVKTWAMNESTYNKLMAEFVALDANGAYVSALNGVMPILGGDIVVIDSIADNTIIAGYYDLYLLAERAGTTIGTSEHAFWVEDQTGFKGTARYDGKVLINNGFVAIGILGHTPAANDVTFAQDGANL